MFPRQLSETIGEGVIHPEAALEVDLAGREAACDQRLNGCLRRLPRGDAGGAKMELARHVLDDTPRSQGHFRADGARVPVRKS